MQNRQSRGPSVHSLVIARTGAHAKDDVSPSRSASSDNLQSQATSHLSEKGIEEPEKNVRTSCSLHTYSSSYAYVCMFVNMCTHIHQDTLYSTYVWGDGTSYVCACMCTCTYLYAYVFMCRLPCTSVCLCVFECGGPHGTCEATYPDKRLRCVSTVCICPWTPVHFHLHLWLCVYS